jgi:hypothetical protein
MSKKLIIAIVITIIITIVKPALLEAKTMHESWNILTKNEKDAYITGFKNGIKEGIDMMALSIIHINREEDALNIYNETTEGVLKNTTNSILYLYTNVAITELVDQVYKYKKYQEIHAFELIGYMSTIQTESDYFTYLSKKKF